MPLYLSKTVFENAKLGVWLIQEDETYFVDHLALSMDEKKLINSFNAKRKIEWLSSRHLIHLLSGRKTRAEILKDTFGKPYIQDSKYLISFSHSHGKSAVIASKKQVGIDIQYIVPKITRIANKFINETEVDFIKSNHSSLNLELLHIIWGAKESLYKAYGKRSLDFKKNMKVEPFFWDRNFTTFSATLIKDDYEASFRLEALKINNYILVYAEKL